jgi:mono/diheme cytochrome c family protein
MRSGWKRRGIAMAFAFAWCAGGAAAADPVTGEGIATRLCAKCHAVGAAGASPNPAALPFAALARNPVINDGTLRTLWRAPHAAMTDIKLDDRQLDDLVSYVLSLRTRS